MGFLCSQTMGSRREVPRRARSRQHWHSGPQETRSLQPGGTKLVLKGTHYSVEIPSGQETCLQCIRALRRLPDASFVWLSIECFLLGDCFGLCSHHFVNISVSVWACCQLEVSLLRRCKALTALSRRGRLEGGRVEATILYCFSFKAFFSALDFVCF